MTTKKKPSAIKLGNKVAEDKPIIKEEPIPVIVKEDKKDDSKLMTIRELFGTINHSKIPGFGFLKHIKK